MYDSGVRYRGKLDTEPDDGFSEDTPEEESGAPAYYWGPLWRIIISMVGTFVIFVAVIQFFVQCPIDPEGFRLPPPPQFEGPLAENTLLKGAQRLHEGHLVGPESLAIMNGTLYTGTADGRVVALQDGDLRLVATLGLPPCGGWANEPTCGRPLGMRFDRAGRLIVVDAYLGVFQVDVTTGAVSQLYSSSTPVEGVAPRFLNDLDIADDGSIYVTDTSYKWQRRDVRLAIWESRPYGRLLRLNTSSGEVKVVLRDLYFANGVQLTADRQSLLIAETDRCRVLRYHLSGKQVGQVEVFADNLPGLPDNIRASPSGGYWLGMALVRQPGPLAVTPYDAGAARPWLRAFVARLTSPDAIERLMTSSARGLVIKLDETGVVTSSLHDPEGHVVRSVSEVLEWRGHLYLGSYNGPLARLELDDDDE